MKKIASLVGAGAMILGMAVPAFAYVHHHSSSDTSVRNYARVTNDVEVRADSGDNEIHGKYVSGGRILTGLADAYSELVNVVNTNDLTIGNDDLSVRNYARVRNEVEVRADSGDNEIGAKYVRGGKIDTGDALAASVIDNTVNTTLTGGDVVEN